MKPPPDHEPTKHRWRDVQGLGQLWYERYIQKKVKHPAVVERILRRHIYPVIGKLAIDEVRPHHIDTA